MKDLNEVLNNIDKFVDMYQTCKLADVHTQSEIGRGLAVNLKYLTDHKTKYHEDWNQAFLESDEKSDKKKEMYANKIVPELYTIRQVQRSTEKILDIVRSTISANKIS